MDIQKIVIAAFSPTGTSLKTAQSVAQGVGLPIKPLLPNPTFANLPAQTLNPDTLLIASVPVYGGAVAPLALQRLQALRGNQTPAVVIAVYGNRDYGHAPEQLSRFLTERGFNVVAAAAFVGEHSYHTALTPIAPGRPNADDLAEAHHFGQAVARKLQAHEVAAVDASRLARPKNGWLATARFVLFVWKLRRQLKKHPRVLVPQITLERCTQCGRCAKLCPTGAINPEHPERTDPQKCIKCAACVKGCKQQARKLPSPFAPVLSKNFNHPKNNVTLL